MKRRALTIALAVLLAVLGTAGVLVYVGNANARALAGQKAVSVLIAKQLIPAGTSAGDAQDQGLLSLERLPAASVPAEALASVTPDISGLVMDADMQPGQVLLRRMLVANVPSSGGVVVPHGMLAVSIQFCVPEAVAGNIHPGSQVAVFDTVSSSSNMSAQAGCSGAHQWQSGLHATTKLILPDVAVLSVGQASAASQQSGGQTTSSSAPQNIDLITLAVSPRDAAQLILMSEDGLPYLALVPAS